MFGRPNHHVSFLLVLRRHFSLLIFSMLPDTLAPAASASVYWGSLFCSESSRFQKWLSVLMFTRLLPSSGIPAYDAQTLLQEKFQLTCSLSTRYKLCALLGCHGFQDDQAIHSNVWKCKEPLKKTLRRREEPSSFRCFILQRRCLVLRWGSYRTTKYYRSGCVNTSCTTYAL